MPEELRWLGWTVGGNPIWRWAVALLVAAVLLVAILVVGRIVADRFARIAARTKTSLDDVLAKPMRATKAVLIAILAVVAGSHVVVLPDVLRRVLDVVSMLALVLQVGLWVQALGRAALDAWASRQEQTGSATVAAGLGFALQVVVWTVLGLLVLANLGVRVDALVAGLGIGGVAAALAVQNVLGDVFASLSLYFDRPFDIGDSVVVGDVQGTVQRIGMRSTRILSLTGEQVIFPNAKLAGSTIRNFRRMEERRIALTIGLASDTPPEKIERAIAAMREAIEAEQGARFDRAHFKGFGAFSLDCEAVYFVLSRELNVLMDRQQAINLRIIRALEAEGIAMAVPTQGVRIIPG